MFEVVRLTAEEDAYIRTGARPDPDVGSITSETVTALVRAKLAGGDASQPWPRQSSLYAMPAFTQTALNDPQCNLAEMLADEVDASFRAQLGTHSIDRFGPVSVLRDPWSSKPYVLFYCEMKRLPIPEGMEVEDAQPDPDPLPEAPARDYRAERDELLAALRQCRATLHDLVQEPNGAESIVALYARAVAAEVSARAAIAKAEAADV